MSASPMRPRATPGTAGPKVPVAGPPPVPPPVALERPVEPEPWWTPESLKGWGASVAMHIVVLVILGLWYFAPDPHPPITIDTRLAGSPSGVEDGETLSGGLNTPFDMPPAPLALEEMEASIVAPPLESLKLDAIEPEAMTRRNRAPTVGGGLDNNNPGAGEGDGFGLARFGDGGETIKGVQVKVGDPQFTLIWNTDVDLDLHVIEPGGKEIFWEDPKGEKGGELDVDNTKGYGPENVYWLVDSDGPGSEKVKGHGPPGVYKWYVVFWSGFGGKAKPTQWQVRVKHAGKVTVHRGKFRALNEHSKVYTLTVDPSDFASAAP